MNRKNYLKTKLNEFGIPFVSQVDIIEAVNSGDRYNDLPLVVKNSLIVISEMHNVKFSFNQKADKLMLTGISNSARSTYLFPEYKDGLEKSQLFIKGSKPYIMDKEGYLIPDNS